MKGDSSLCMEPHVIALAPCPTREFTGRWLTFHLSWLIPQLSSGEYISPPWLVPQLSSRGEYNDIIDLGIFLSNKNKEKFPYRSSNAKLFITVSSRCQKPGNSGQIVKTDQ